MERFRLFMSLLLLAGFSLGKEDLHPDLLTGRKGNPGIKLRLTELGLGYIREVAVRVLNKEIPNLRIPSMKQAVTIFGQKGDVMISNIRIDEYIGPSDYSLYLIEPSSLSWAMENMGVTATGNFDGTFMLPLVAVPVKANGQFTAILHDFDFEIMVDIGNKNGYPTIRVRRCLATIASVQVDIHNAGLLVNTAIGFFKGAIEQMTKPMVEQQICVRVDEIINRDVNKIMRTLPLNMPLGGLGISRKKRSVEDDLTNELEGLDVARRFEAYSKNLILDFHLTRAPRVGAGTVTTRHRGEISWKGQGHTPFYPHDMGTGSTQGAMVQLYASDYMVNSLLYHLYKQKLLNVNVSPKTFPAVRDLLVTTCDNFCIGDLIPGLDEFENHQVVLFFKPTKPPVGFFVPGSAVIAIVGEIKIYVRKPKDIKGKRVVTLKASVGFETKLNIKKNKVVGKARVRKFKLTLIDSKLKDLDQDDIDEMGDLSKSIMTKMMTQILEKGVEIPLIDGVELRKPKLSFKKHFALVQSYFKIDEGFILKLVRDTFRQGGSR